MVGAAGCCRGVAGGGRPAPEPAEAGDAAAGQRLPSIAGLYTPEPNPDGKFTVPTMTGGAIEVERVGGPVPDATDAADATDATAVAGRMGEGAFDGRIADMPAAEGQPSRVSDAAANIAGAVASTPAADAAAFAPETAAPAADAAAQQLQDEAPKKQSWLKRLFG